MILSIQIMFNICIYVNKPLWLKKNKICENNNKNQLF